MTTFSTWDRMTAPSRIMLAVVLAVLFTSAGLANDGKKPPNIILVMSDDQGYGDAGFMGHKELRTPALDAMAKDGLTFRRFYAAAPVCSPTRASCLTGRHPFRQGIYFANVGHLREQEITLQQLLKRAGYVTGHFGKWHLGTLTTAEKDSNRGGPKGKQHFAPPWQRDFDVCFSTEAKVPTWNPMKHPKTGKPYGTAYWTGQGKKETTNLDGDDSRVIMDRAIPFIQDAAKKETPFFAVIWFHTPHEPVVGGDKYLQMYDRVKGEKTRHYYACLTAMDEQIGRLRAELQKLGIADNTVIWFCSDNGPEGQTGPGSAGGLRGRKRSLLEGGIRVPGIVVWPGTIKAGRVTDIPACTSDYLPTMLDVLKLQMPDARPLDGVSLLPLFEGKMKERPRPIAFASGKQRALVDNRFSLYSPNGKTWQLYDLKKDAGQKTDLAAQMPQKVLAMRREFNRWYFSMVESLQGQDYPKK